jgi:hypothetical protein
MTAPCIAGCSSYSPRTAYYRRPIFDVTILPLGKSKLSADAA